MKEFWKWCLAGGIAGAIFAVFGHLDSPMPEGEMFYAVLGEIVGSAFGGVVLASLAFLVYRWRRKKPYE